MSVAIDPKIQQVLRRTDFEAVARSFYVRGEVLRRRADEERPLDLTGAILDYSLALLVADPDSDAEIFDAAVRALCETIPFGRPLGYELALVLRSVSTRFDTARPGRFARREPEQDVWVRWLRGLLLSRFGAHQRAITLFHLSRRSFERLELLPEYLAISLDLGGVWHLWEFQKELQDLAAEMVFRYRSLDSLDARCALCAWRDMVLHHDLTEEQHLAVRRKLWSWLHDDIARRRADPEYCGPTFSRWTDHQEDPEEAGEREEVDEER